MSYQDDKRELLKLKQGLIEESESIKEEEKPTYELHGWKKVSNFFYHYKWYVIVAVFFIAVSAYFIYTTATIDKPDVSVLLITQDGENSLNVANKVYDFEQAFEQYTPNFDGNAYVHVKVYNIDLSENARTDYMASESTKLYAEINLAESMMYVIDSVALDRLTKEGESDCFVDLGERYPDCPHVSGNKYHIKGSGFDLSANYVEACPDDLYIVIRKVYDTTANRDRAIRSQETAFEVLDNIVSGNLAGWEFEEGRVYAG